MTDKHLRETTLAAMRASLAKAMTERPQRPDLEICDGERYPGWVFHERSAMVTAVNTIRADLGMPAVSADMVKRAEDQAAGHVDYASKFALYCTEIVLGDDRWLPTDAPANPKE